MALKQLLIWLIKLRYLPLFYKDLEEKIVYITEELHNEKAANYRIYVKNFVVYYVVIDDEGEDKIMEVRRFLYNKQDVKRFI